jgi:hypothetical protein
MALDPEKTYERLYSYCKNEEFAGHDPFDGLNSVLFWHTPLKYFATARLAWLQMVKRSPVDLRRFLRVPKGINPKGLALFTLAELSRFRTTKDDWHAQNARDLAARLLAAKIVSSTGDSRPTAAFGYNFDWQSRVFFAPVGTPAIVPTAFAARALVEMFQVFGNEKYLRAAKEICEFILNGLNRSIETDDEVCFSYTPVDNSVIFNASLLAGETLASVGALTENKGYVAMAAKTLNFVIHRQRGDGAWAYGANESQAWIDNFHTAYVLISLHRISDAIPDLRSEISDSVGHGINYWLTNFFCDDGAPKYYDRSRYPIDIHSAAAAIVTFCELSSVDDRMLSMANRTAEWTIENMFDSEGYFYYQIRKTSVIRTPYMRWGQAWMAYALAKLMEKHSEQTER